MRTFIAIELPQPVRSALSELQNELKGCHADIRWVRPEGIHLTLKFLGEVPEGRLGEIREKAAAACRGHHQFDIEFRGTGVFPDERSPRVLWVGTVEEAALSALRDDIETAMESAGFRREDRRFVPHLTLGRFRSRRGSPAVTDSLAAMRQRSFGRMRVSSVSLMKSELRPGGAVYSRLETFRLPE